MVCSLGTVGGQLGGQLAASFGAFVVLGVCHRQLVFVRHLETCVLDGSHQGLCPWALAHQPSLLSAQ